MEMDSNDENDLGLFGDGFGGSSPGPLEESSPSENRDQICNICRWDNELLTLIFRRYVVLICVWDALKLPHVTPVF